MIQAQNYSCYYKNRKKYVRALDDLSFTIADGELFVVAGESGCGKTSLLQGILGRLEYTQGALLIDGAPAEAADLGDIGYVRQEPGLYPHMTVYENIAFPLRVLHTAQAEIDRRVKEMAEVAEIEFLLTRKPKQLSLGQQQRVAVARALIKQPSLVLMDEPFSNLDPTLRASMRQLVRTLHEQFRPTIVFVTHDLAEAFSLADRLLVLEEGHIADMDTPMGLLEHHHSELLRIFLK